jgi:hypothetical protein
LRRYDDLRRIEAELVIDKLVRMQRLYLVLGEGVGGKVLEIEGYDCIRAAVDGRS